MTVYVVFMVDGNYVLGIFDSFDKALGRVNGLVVENTEFKGSDGEKCYEGRRWWTTSPDNNERGLDIVEWQVNTTAEP